jgi:hypothetical protein
MNIEGITNEEALIFPNGEANCMNWVLGHLIHIRNPLLNILGEEPFGTVKNFPVTTEGKFL